MARKAQIVDGVNQDAVAEFAPIVRGGGTGSLVGEVTYAGQPVRVVTRQSTDSKGKTATYANVEGLDDYLRVGRQPVSARALYNAFYIADTMNATELTRFRKLLAKALAVEEAERNNGTLNAIKHRSAQNAGNRADAAAVEAYHTQANASAIAQAVAATLAGLGIVAPKGQVVDETA